MKWWVDFHYWHPRLQRPKAGWWVIEAPSKEEALRKFWEHAKRKGIQVLQVVWVGKAPEGYPVTVR